MSWQNGLEHHETSSGVLGLALAVADEGGAEEPSRCLAWELMISSLTFLIVMTGMTF